MTVITLVIVVFLAFANGANDNFKGVATLFGSKVASYNTALAWGTFTTFLGSIVAVFLASSLVAQFSGKGLVPELIVGDSSFILAVVIGTTATVLLATKIGMPVSTTHGLLGGIFGAGLIATGSDFNFDKLINSFFLALIFSPLIAAILSIILYSLFKKLRKKLNVSRDTCVCIGKKYVPVYQSSDSCDCYEFTSGSGVIKIADTEECIEVYGGSFMGIRVNRAVSIVHFISAGWVSFARGLNDTPKIVGLIIGLELLQVEWSLLIIGVFMVLGAIFNARKVADTMSNKITNLNQGQGLTANLITGGLVTLASIFALPVSTTHVSVGAIFGMGITSKERNRRMIKKITLSWVLTLPLAAIIAAFSYLIINLVS